MNYISGRLAQAMGVSLLVYTSFLQAEEQNAPLDAEIMETTNRDIPAQENNPALVAGIFGTSSKIVPTEKAKKERPAEEKRGGIFSAEFLYWSTNYSLPFAFDFNLSSSQLFSQVPAVAFQSTSVKAHFIRPPQRWTPGFRLGFGGNTGFDGWELQAYYTYYSNETEKKVFSDEQTINTAWQKGKAKFHLNYQVGDLELGRIFYSSPKITIRPFCGIRGAWIDQDNHASFQGNSVSFTDAFDAQFAADQPLSIKIDLDVRAIGPRIGLNSNWGSYRGLSILANVSGALLYGKGNTHANVNVVSVTQNSDNAITDSQTKINVRDKFWDLFPNLQMLLGVTWGYSFGKNKNMLRISASWETNFWWEAANILVFDRALSMQGLTAGIGIDF